MYIEKLHLTGIDGNEVMSASFQKGICIAPAMPANMPSPESIISFFFYGVLPENTDTRINGVLYFCDSSVHYRINRNAEGFLLYKLTAEDETRIELDDGVEPGDILFELDCELFKKTLSIRHLTDERLKALFSDLLNEGGGIGLYGFMDRVRACDGAEKTCDGNLDATASDDPDGDTKKIPFVGDAQIDPLEQTKAIKKVDGDLDVKVVSFERDETKTFERASDLGLGELERRANELRINIETTTEEISKLSRKLEIGRMSDLAARITTYKEKKEKYESALERKRFFEDTYRSGTIELPDNAYVNELKYSVEEIGKCDAELKEIHKEMEEIDPEHHSNRLSNLYIKVNDEGGIDAVKEKLKHCRSSKLVNTLACILFTLAGLMFICVGAAFTLLPVYKTEIFETLTLTWSHVGLIGLTFGLLSLIPSIMCLSRVQTLYEDIKDMYVEYCCEGAKTPDEFIKMLEEEMGESEEKKERLKRLKEVEKKVAACQSRVNEGQRIIREHLTIWSRPFDNRLSYCENALSAIEYAESFLKEYEVIKNETERARMEYEDVRYYVVGLEDRIMSPDFDPEELKVDPTELEYCEQRSEMLKKSLIEMYDELDSVKNKQEVIRSVLLCVDGEEPILNKKEEDSERKELLERLSVVADSENADAWETALVRSYMIADRHRELVNENVAQHVVMLSCMETFYSRIMPVQIITHTEGSTDVLQDALSQISESLLTEQIILC